MFNISDYVVTDDLTILLALIAATTFLLNNLYKPQPLVHPILLGRQSDVGRARNPGESAVYRNYGTGLMGRFPVRPSKEIAILPHFIKPESEASRTLWATRGTNAGLQDRIAALGSGLIRLAGLKPGESKVLLLLNDGIEFIIADFALATHSVISVTLNSQDLLKRVLESQSFSAIIASPEIVPRVLETIYASSFNSRSHTIVIVGDVSQQTLASVASNIKILKFNEVEREGIKVDKLVSKLPEPSDIYTMTYLSNEAGQLQVAQLTHENATAGVAATRSLLPISHALSPLDTIISAFSLSTAYGRVIAYTAIYEGASFATLPSSKMYHDEQPAAPADASDILAAKRYPIPSPTIMFIQPGHLIAIVTDILKNAAGSMFLFPFARRHKLAGISDGFITRESLWDRLVFDGARAKVIGDGAATLRGVIVSGRSLPAVLMTPARMALSVPLVNTFTHPLVAGPVLASHPFDLQDFTEEGVSSEKKGHVGPPSVNVEAKLTGVDDEKVENGGDPTGLLFVRGPPVGKIGNGDQNEDYVQVSPTEERRVRDENAEEGWISTGVRAQVQPNGSFIVL
ncbi:hypothetical protein Agabi119p4_3543 [Agaricus bisporus var. burnettii]|uniref:AMP-dependent synthetase/ligase domain-containing protein n=1 Tax=Agaricus bisporus var. burnettii TaxID=192524 RepID=A0A8H7KHS5_AGABI|nr:hypothetical protein Agabi119p4_3543 [Agaricus bisporus var. burnettii]